MAKSVVVRARISQELLDRFDAVVASTPGKRSDHIRAALESYVLVYEQGKTKVSFLLCLANQKSPDTAIVNEDVLFVRKPL